MSPANDPTRPIIIVTGANNGVGFGICRRLLCGLAQGIPEDAHPVFPRSGSADDDKTSGLEYPCSGLTLIMACRSRQRAEAARKELLELFERDVAPLRAAPGGAERIAAFRANLVVSVHLLDLASVHSTLAFAYEVARTYPYVSHLVCNAGVAPFLKISWSLFCQQLWREILRFSMLRVVTEPAFYLQRVGLMSDDGLGWAWQCNVFGHYILCRALEAKLAASRTGPGRVLWMSSHQASGDAHDPEDWQVVQNPKPYEATKFQIDLIRAELSRRVGPSASIRYFTVDPGVVDSSMHTALDAGIKFYIKMITFYIARLFGSLEHNISAWNGAAATVYVCLAPLAFIPIFLSAAGTPIAQADEQKDSVLPLRMHSQTNLMGRNTTAAVPLYTWPEYEKEASRLVDRCERLYQSFLTAGGKTPQLRD